jgi:hypothetical protein
MTMNTNGRGLAMIANCMTPYRAHLHELVAKGIPELKLHSLITHGAADFDWAVNVPPSIHATYFNEAGESALSGVTEHPYREWRKGARLIDYLVTHNVCAAICTGYQYPSYLRLIAGCYRRQIPLFVRNDSNIKSDARLSPVKQFFKRKVYDWWIPRVAGVMSMGGRPHTLNERDLIENIGPVLVGGPDQFASVDDHIPGEAGDLTGHERCCVVELAHRAPVHPRFG